MSTLRKVKSVLPSLKAPVEKPLKAELFIKLCVPDVIRAVSAKQIVIYLPALRNIREREVLWEIIFYRVIVPLQWMMCVQGVPKKPQTIENDLLLEFQWPSTKLNPHD